MCVPVIGDMDLFAAFREAAGDRVTVVGVTGTNGKSTCTALVGAILAHDGRHVRVGGNTGLPVLAMEGPASSGHSVYVIEVSSAQAEMNVRFAPDVAVLTNVASDHLDRHGDMASYVAAKSRLFLNAPRLRHAIVGCDGPGTVALADRLAAGGVRVTRIRPGDPCTVDRGGGDRGARRRSEGPGAWVASLAAAAGSALGVDSDACAAAIRGFKGLPHRLETVARIGGVTFVNDSKATNVHAARHALSACDDTYWIAGGRAKPGGFADLASECRSVRAAFFIGEAAADMVAALAPHVRHEICGTLEAAFDAAAAAALRERPDGATVLLSPACASFDQFSDFEERGEAFRALAHERAAAPRKTGGASSC